MAYSFPRPVTDYACGTLELLLQRIEQHREAHQGRMPLVFVMHPGSSAALNSEHYKRYGQPHNMQFAGVPIELCRCAAYYPRCYPSDFLKTADGKIEDL